MYCSVTVSENLYGSVRNDDLSCCCACCRSSGRGKEDFHFGGSHSSEKIPVVGGNDPFSVGKDTAGSAAAESASRMSDNGAGFCQDSQCSVSKSLIINFPAGRRNDQLYEGGDRLSLQDGSGFLQIFQTPVSAGADEDLSMAVPSYSLTGWILSTWDGHARTGTSSSAL